MKCCSFIKYFFFNILIPVHLVSSVYGQTGNNKYPGIGDKCPDFVLNNLFYYSNTNARYDDFKGKPVILNFFSMGCGSSFESLPHLKEMQKEFDGRVQFIMIGRSDAELKREYEKYRVHYNLDFPVDYDDSTLWKMFGVYYVAYTIWIDASGTIRQITTPYALNREALNNLLNGTQQPMVVSENLYNHENYQSGSFFYDPDKPYLIKGNGGPDTSFSYRSIFCKWDYRTSFMFDHYISSKNGNKLFETGESVLSLYKLAYGDTVQFQKPIFPLDTSNMEVNTYSQWSNTPILETKRKDLITADYSTGKNIFTYSLNVPETLANPHSLQSILQRELTNYFGFEARVETRSRPCWKIISLGKNKNTLTTKGGKPEWKGTFSTTTFRNMPVSALISSIWGFNQDEYTFIDETGIQGNIDLDMDCIWTDLTDVKKELRKNGLDLVKTQKMLKVLVIRDAE